MSDSPIPTDGGFDSGPSSERKRLMLLGGVAAGVLVLGGGGYLLLGGGGSDDSSDAIVLPARPPATASASPSASASASPSSEAALAVFRGAVGRDPFEVPAKVAAALSPAAAPASGPAVGTVVPPAPVASALPTTATSGTVPGAPGGGVVVLDPSLPSAIGPTSPTGGMPTSSSTQMPVIAPTTAVTNPVQYLELLRVRHAAKGWYATVRTNNGVAEVVEGTPNVGGTKFFFVGEDETTGKPTFVFTVGESEGGDLVPDARLTAKTVKPGNSTLTLKNGEVDGGIVAE